MPRMLIVKTSSLGDVIHNLPVLADIRAHVPDMQFDWVVEESFADIPGLHPAVSRVIPVAMRRWRKHPFSRQTWREIAACRRQLRDARYDLVLDSQGLLKSAWIARWASAPIHGLDRASAREPLAAQFYQHRHAVPRGLHAVVRNRQLAALALGYAMPATPPQYGIHAGTALHFQPPATPYIVGLHATSRDTKRWPTQRWVDLAAALQARGISLLLPWGSAKERERAQNIATQAGNVQVLPKLAIADIAPVLAHALAAVGVDTGLAHLAVALDLPTVAIYTDTHPALTGVLPQYPERTRNLGGRGLCPGSEEVMAAITEITTLPSGNT